MARVANSAGTRAAQPATIWGAECCETSFPALNTGTNAGIEHRHGTPTPNTSTGLRHRTPARDSGAGTGQDATQCVPWRVLIAAHWGAGCHL